MLNLFASRRSIVLRGLLLAGAVYSVAAAQAPMSETSSPARTFSVSTDAESSGETKYLLREGSQLVNQRGSFRRSSDRIYFNPPDNEQGFVVLENLALERVAQVLLETTGQRQWSVSGTMTEYRGENFLLVTRAILQSRHTPTTPVAPAETTSAEE